MVVIHHHRPHLLPGAQHVQELIDACCAALMPGGFGLLRIIGKNLPGGCGQARSGFLDTLAHIHLQADHQQAQHRQQADQFPQQRMAVGQPHGASRVRI